MSPRRTIGSTGEPSRARVGSQCLRRALQGLARWTPCTGFAQTVLAGETDVCEAGLQGRLRSVGFDPGCKRDGIGTAEST